MGMIQRGSFTAIGTPDAVCNVAFAHSVAEAYKQAALGRIDLGQIQTVVANPQWTLSKLYGTYQHLSSREFHVNYKMTEVVSKRSSLINRAVRLATPFRSILESQVLPLFPRLAPRLKGEYRVQSVHRDRVQTAAFNELKPVFNLIGPVPGVIVNETRSSPEETVLAYQQIEARLEAVLEHGVAQRC
jgi:hypothetical protein